MNNTWAFRRTGRALSKNSLFHAIRVNLQIEFLFCEVFNGAVRFKMTTPIKPVRQIWTVRVEFLKIMCSKKFTKISPSFFCHFILSLWLFLNLLGQTLKTCKALTCGIGSAPVFVPLFSSLVLPRWKKFVPKITWILPNFYNLSLAWTISRYYLSNLKADRRRTEYILFPFDLFHARKYHLPPKNLRRNIYKPIAESWHLSLPYNWHICAIISCKIKAEMPAINPITMQILPNHIPKWSPKKTSPSQKEKDPPFHKPYESLPWRTWNCFSNVSFCALFLRLARVHRTLHRKSGPYPLVLPLPKKIFGDSSLFRFWIFRCSHRSFIRGFHQRFEPFERFEIFSAKAEFTLQNRARDLPFRYPPNIHPFAW